VKGVLGPPQGLVQRVVRSIDWVVVTLTVAIAALALTNLESAAGGSGSGMIREQAIYLAVGAVALIAAASVQYPVYYRLAYPMYAVGVSLVVLVFVVGKTLNQARRWLDVGFRFQPSELIKLLLLIALARFIHDVAGRNDKSLRGLIVPAGMAILPAAFIVVQPHLSTAIIVLLIGVSMLAASGLTLRGALVLLSTAVLGAMVGWRFLFETYQKERIDVWLNPELYADEGGYQILQARTAVGNGGFLGRGVGQGTQNTLDFVPYKESDFSFAVYAEEWGFVGTGLLLALYASLILWALNVASQARDRFSALLCVGVASLVFWHVVLNVGVVLEFFPNTGLPLPFFSKGGSNVLTMMLALGVLMSVSRSRKYR
jgi:rod shape determining protein RodA